MNQAKRITVLHIAHISNDYTSGVSNVVPQLLNWQNTIPNLNVALLNLNSYTPRDATYPVYPTRRIACLPAPYNKPDLVVFHEIYRKNFFFLYNELKKNNIQYVITPHGSLNATAQKQHYFAKAILNAVFFKRFIKRARIVQFLSEQEMKQSKRFETTDARIIPNGIIMPANPSRKNYQTNNFIFIGRLDIFVKGLDLLVESAYQVAKKLREREAHIKIYGPDCDGSLPKLQSQIEEKGVADLCELCGPIAPTDKEGVLSNALCYIQLSRTEGFPTTIIEALSYGLPIIVSEGTTWKNLTNAYGIGFGVLNDPKEIGEKMIEIVDNPSLRHSMSINATEIAATQFQWPMIAKRYEELYSEITARQSQ